jgi:thioredoxin-dependent peroxiredoxin
VLSWIFSDPLPAGTAAPDFSLPDESGKTWTLASLRGRNVLLVFYPADNTSGCTAQLCDVRDRWDLLKAKNVAAFGVNPQNPSSHARFKDKFKFPFPLLVDSGQRVAGLYHCNGIFVKRTVYLIGPDGRIAFSQRGAPSAEQILKSA